MEEMNQNPVQPETVEVVDIQFRPGQKVYFFDPAGMQFQAGDHVIMDTARGPEYGICTAGNHVIPAKDVVSPLRPVLRHATEQDERIVQENREKEKRAFAVCQQKIAEQALDMQLVSAECVFDGSKILFFFTADERVDFRELVKSLAGTFHTRIELRQIGVRDKAKMVGGLGICGRPFCCASFLDDFQPVSIKMAKTQNLSLNPSKISGTCGRLLCCLKYEQDAYEDLLRTSPKQESFVDTPQGRGTVVEVDLLRQRVKVKMEEQPEVIATFANSEIAVLRSGKAKKNDPPIPADLAPISGTGRQVRKEESQEEKSVYLDSIRLRYSTETIAEETAEQEEVVESILEETQQENHHRSRRRKSRGHSGERIKVQTEENAQTERPQSKAERQVVKPEKQSKPAPTETKPEEPGAENGEKAKHHRRRPSHRRHRPNKDRNPGAQES